MTATELQTRTEKAQYLPVTCVGLGIFYVESEQGNVCYRVEIGENAITCTCADYVKNARNDKEFKCKHILAMLDVKSDDIAKAEFLHRNKPKLADCWIVDIKGKEFVLYSGLLDLAHQKGLLKLEVEAIQHPTKENGNIAICKAIATSRLGEVYTDVGDANPNNTAPMIAKHLLRMASTRAKARVLRDFSNIGMTALEELGDFDDVIGKGTSGKGAVAKKATDNKATVTNIASQAKKSPVRKKAPTSSATQVKEVAKAIEDVKQFAQAKVETIPAQKKVAPKKTQEEVSEARPQMSVAQKKAIANLAKRRGITEDELNDMTAESFNVTFEFMTPADASTLIRQLQQSA